MPMFGDLFGDIRRRFRNPAGGVAPTPTVDQLRTATFAKLQRVITAAQTGNPRDVAPIGITPTTSLTPTLSNEVTYQNSPGSFEVLGGAPLVTNDPTLFIICDAEDSPNNGGGESTFMPNARPTWSYSGTWNVKVVNTRYIEIVTSQMSGPVLRLWVNGRMVNAGRVGYTANAGSGLNYTLYDLGAVGTYEIGIEVNSSTRFKGLRVDASATVSKPTRADTVTALYLGDSYTAGVSSAATGGVRGDDLMNNVSQYLGFKNSITAAVSGAALVTNTGVKLIPQFYTDFVKTTIAPVADPDVIFIAAGYNDNGSSGPTVAAAYAFWQQVRADFPRALIVVVGMWGGVIQARATLQNREEALRAQFGTWADPFSIFFRSVYAVGAAALNAIQYGTGYAGTPANDGINDYILGSDRNHYTDGFDQRNGAWYMSARLRDAFISRTNDLGTTYNPSQTKVSAWPLSIKGAAASTPAAAINTAYLFQTMVDGGVISTASATSGAAVRTFSISSGTLPPGLTLGTTTGSITGQVTAAGTYNFTIQVTDGVSTATLPVTITAS